MFVQWHDFLNAVYVGRPNSSTAIQLNADVVPVILGFNCDADNAPHYKFKTSASSRKLSDQTILSRMDFTSRTIEFYKCASLWMWFVVLSQNFHFCCFRATAYKRLWNWVQFWLFIGGSIVAPRLSSMAPASWACLSGFTSGWVTMVRSLSLDWTES